jgi:hypothetical protein
LLQSKSGLGLSMPLGPDASANIRELYRHGSKPRSRDQIIAIGLSAARRAKRRGRRRSRR